ncbi:MAG: FeoA family protein [Leptolyngbyaceae cyanobacterium MO_188.B28]|nr:FeoA family protein [Leptolyngbyaceae cyanobacterium MO_188.B28]
MTNLNSLAIGEAAVITLLTAEVRLQQQLCALGFRPGRQVSVVRKAGFSGPLHLRMGVTEVMLRRREAQQVYVVSVEPEHDDETDCSVGGAEYR